MRIRRLKHTRLLIIENNYIPVKWIVIEDNKCTFHNSALTPSFIESHYYIDFDFTNLTYLLK